MVVIRREKPPTATHGTCRWLSQPSSNRCQGILLLGAVPYLFEPLLFQGRIYGFRLSRQTDAGPPSEYQLPVDLSACDCADAVFREGRPGGCKHRRALAMALGVLGTDRAYQLLVF
jgi:hypothetical protein